MLIEFKLSYVAMIVKLAEPTINIQQYAFFRTGGANIFGHMVPLAK